MVRVTAYVIGPARRAQGEAGEVVVLGVERGVEKGEPGYKYRRIPVPREQLLPMLGPPTGDGRRPIDQGWP